MTNSPDPNTSTNATAPDVLTAFINDLTNGARSMIKHQSGGQWAAVILSLALTAYVWYYYGPGAGAPLAASFFVCVAMVMPTT